MNKQEFLQRLRMALAGEVPGNVIEENLRYYDEYISSEAAGGQTEEAVTAAIGDPRLIAKTIIDVTETAEESGSSGSYDTHEGSRQTVYEEDGRMNRSFHSVDLSKWYWKLILTIAVVLIIGVVFLIIGGIFSILIPLFGPILMILVIYGFFRNMRR